MASVDETKIAEFKKVFPPDGRKKVDDTLKIPYLFVGQLEITFPDGTRGVGTGTLISPYHVLTCAHNLYQNKHGKYAKKVIFNPARNEEFSPFGNYEFERLDVPDEYISLSPEAPVNGIVDDYTRYLYDFGVVTLKEKVKIATSGFLQLYDARAESLKSDFIDIAGYPGDKPANTMWDARGKLTSFDDSFLFYKISTASGQSGSSLRENFNDEDGLERIVGIHVAGSSKIGSNFAVRLDSDKIIKIENWMGHVD